MAHWRSESGRGFTWSSNAPLRIGARSSCNFSALPAAYAGTGLFVLPSLVRADVVDTYGVRCLGALDGLAERYYAHTMERRIQNPAIAAIVRAAEAQLDH